VRGGYIGSSLVSQLQNLAEHCLSLHHGNQDKRHQPSDKFHITKDFSKSLTWKDILKNIDILFHCGAQTNLYQSQRCPPDDFRDNVLPLKLCLEACQKFNYSPIIIFASTVTIAGITNQLPVDESHSDKPITVYDLHKKKAEHYLKDYAKLGVIQGLTLRLPNIYGPGPIFYKTSRGFLNKMIQAALFQHKLTLYRPGDWLRDYLHINDTVLAFIISPYFIDKLNAKHFILGTQKGHTIREVLELVAKFAHQRTGIPVHIEEADPPGHLSPIEFRNFVANTHNFRTLTGWQAHVSLESGIKKLIKDLA